MTDAEVFALNRRSHLILRYAVQVSPHPTPGEVDTVALTQGLVRALAHCVIVNGQPEAPADVIASMVAAIVRADVLFLAGHPDVQDALREAAAHGNPAGHA